MTAPRPGTISGMSHAMLCAFVGPAQRQAVYHGLRGEEKQYFADTLRRLAGVVEGMPKTYESESVADPMVWLHYFTAGADFYITEKDVDSDDAGQCQAFGLADLYGDGGELGYVSITEITQHGAELDFHFTPTPLSMVRATYCQFVKECNAARKEG